MSKTMQSQDGVGLLQMGDTLIVYWSQPATLERWRYQLKTMNAMAAAHPSGILVLVVISAVDTLPNVAVREEMQSALRRLSGKIRKLVAVPLGESVMLSLTRTLLRGLIVVSGQSHRHSLAVRISDGLKQLREQASADTPSLEELAKGADELLAALEAEQAARLASPIPNAS